MTELPVLRLTRMEQTPDGVFGELTLPLPWPKLVTCEDDWLDNQRGKSCIPAGIYLLHRTVYHKHNYEVFEVTGVQGRDHILLHAGNTEEDTEGCILVGMRRGKIMVSRDEDTGLPKQVKEAVVDSRHAFQEALMACLAHVDAAMLSIEWAPGLPLGVSQTIS